MKYNATVGRFDGPTGCDQAGLFAVRSLTNCRTALSAEGLRNIPPAAPRAGSIRLRTRPVKLRAHSSAGACMTDTNAPDWAAIRRRYEETQDRIQDICAEAGLDRSRFETRRRKEKWRRRNPRPFPPSRSAARKPAAEVPAAGDGLLLTGSSGATDASPSVPGTARIAPRLFATRASRRRLLDRLVAAIDMKLEQLERRMTNDLAAGEDATATDHEREARAIGALIDNLEKITEIETGLGNATGKSGSSANATSDLADEADRCRRELAERLHRIIEAAEKDA